MRTIPFHSMRTIPLLSAYHSRDLFTFETIGKLLIVSSKFIPALTARLVSDDERALLALPIRLGGLGIADPQTISDFEFAASERVTSPLVGLILKQDMSFRCHVVDAQHLAKAEVIASKRQAAEERAASVCDSLPSDLKRMISLLVNRVLRLGFLPYLWKSMVLLSTRVLFGMLFSCIMGGSLLGCLCIVFVARVSP